MKRKIVNPDIQQKKRQQAIEKVQENDLKQELESERSALPQKIPKTKPKTGHK